MMSALEDDDPRYGEELLKRMEYDSSTNEWIVSIPSFHDGNTQWPAKKIRVPHTNVMEQWRSGAQAATTNAKFTTLMELAANQYAAENCWSRTEYERARDMEDTDNPNNLDYMSGGYSREALAMLLPEGSEIYDQYFSDNRTNDSKRHELSNIQNSTPDAKILLSVEWGSERSGRHAVELIGFDGDYAIVRNPHNTAEVQRIAINRIKGYTVGIPHFDQLEQNRGYVGPTDINHDQQRQPISLQPHPTPEPTPTPSPEPTPTPQPAPLITIDDTLTVQEGETLTAVAKRILRANGQPLTQENINTVKQQLIDSINEDKKGSSVVKNGQQIHYLYTGAELDLDRFAA